MTDPRIPLATLDDPELLLAVRSTLTGAGIDYRLHDGPDGTEVRVAARDLDRALAEVDELMDDGRPTLEAARPEPPPAPAPTGALQTALALVLFHVGVLFWGESPYTAGVRPILDWGLRSDLLLEQPWRLLTHLIVHMDLRHVLGNALGLVVFSVPLLGRIGYGSTFAVYLLSGIGGGLTGIRFVYPGTLLVGSSGAVAGLFGAWVALQLTDHAAAGDDWRRRIRTWGVAVLVLPTLMTPETRTGESISVAAHLGGAATGAVVGGIIARLLLWRQRRAELAAMDAWLN